jgi:hypothetical protein
MTGLLPEAALTFAPCSVNVPSFFDIRIAAPVIFRPVQGVTHLGWCKNCVAPKAWAECVWVRFSCDLSRNSAACGHVLRVDTRFGVRW